MKHRLVSYIKQHPKGNFYHYTLKVANELKLRNIRYQEKYLEEIKNFCCEKEKGKNVSYPEHNERYLKQCFFNLQEKYDRGIITENEYKRIEEKIKKIESE